MEAGWKKQEEWVRYIKKQNEETSQSSRLWDQTSEGIIQKMNNAVEIMKFRE